MNLLAVLGIALAVQKPVAVPFRIGHDAIIIDAKVNGAPVSLMFDTGFGGTVVLDPAVNVGKPTGSMTLRDFVGEMQAKTVKLRTMSLGTQNVPVADKEVVQTGSNYSESYGQHVDGILGLSAVKDAVFEINFQRKELVFHPASLDVTKRTPDNRNTFLARLLPIGSNSLELAVTTDKGKMMTLALDTGNAFYATTHRDVLERIGLWPAGKAHKFSRLVGVASGPVESWNFQMPPVKIFGIPVGPTVWDIIDLPSSSAEGDGTVGFGFLKNFNITVDYNRRRVWFERFTGPLENAEAGDIGLSAAYDFRLKRNVVMLVAPDSPAALAGIKEGDHLLAVDGIDLGDIGYRRMRQMLEGAIDSKVRLATSRNGALKRHELTRKPLVNVP